MTEVKRCRVCGFTLSRNNAVMVGKNRNKLGTICHNCERDRVREVRNKNKEKINAARNARRNEALANEHKCSYCGLAMKIMHNSETKSDQSVLNCCTKCANEKNNEHNIYSIIERGERPSFVIKFGSKIEQREFMLNRDLQIAYSGAAYGGRTAKVGQCVIELVEYEDEDHNIHHSLENKKCRCGGLIRYDKRDEIYCTECFLIY